MVLERNAEDKKSKGNMDGRSKKRRSMVSKDLTQDTAEHRDLWSSKSPLG